LYGTYLKTTVAISDPVIIPRKTKEPKTPSFSLSILTSSLIAFEAAGIDP